MAASGEYLGSEQIKGLTAYDPNGEKIGTVEQVYVDDVTGRSGWATVKTGLFGMKESFVPLDGARRTTEGLRVAHSKDMVKDAPRIDADQHLDADEEQRLYTHYGIARRSGTTTGMKGRTAGTGMAGTAAGTGTAAGRVPAGAGARSRDDQSLILSEEHLEVSTREEEVGHARLRKVVVTENVTTTIPVSHEEVHLVREPIREGDRVAADFGEAQREVTLHAERPVIRKEAVAVERVRLETDRITEQQEVTDTVRKEKAEYDAPPTDMPGERGRRSGGPGRH
ncbi:DUF2382 domain-containing protein [Streptomyces sp. NPDC091279]|uniref:DUF2382 domain-containing protein n=1 Tax=unclassified Streptomyces TaxID=2593676 RepID=UPI0038218A85